MDADLLGKLLPLATQWGFTGLMTIGLVNIVGFFVPGLTSTSKLVIAFVAAFGLSFVPADVGNMLLDKIIKSLEVVAATSGFYRLTQNAGGK
jgi:hypothetical protein